MRTVSFSLFLIKTVSFSLFLIGIECMLKPPDCIILLDATKLHGEAASQNVPVVGVVDTDSVRIYSHIYIYMCVCVCVCIQIYIYIYICIYIYI